MTVEINLFWFLPLVYAAQAFAWWCGWDHRGDVEWMRAHSDGTTDG